MPVATLFVEGELDEQLLRPILSGNPVVERGGSKGSLFPQAMAESKRRGVDVRYLRDRDFDFEAPLDRSHPSIDRNHQNRTVGWRWSRHSVENYLIDPDVVVAAISI